MDALTTGFFYSTECVGCVVDALTTQHQEVKGINWKLWSRTASSRFVAFFFSNSGQPVIILKKFQSVLPYLHGKRFRQKYLEKQKKVTFSRQK